MKARSDREEREVMPPFDLSLYEAFMMIPGGWGFEIRSYEDGYFTVELWRFDKTPFAETGHIPIHERGKNLANTIWKAATRAIRTHNAG
jgi:hypothetical protein